MDCTNSKINSDGFEIIEGVYSGTEVREIQSIIESADSDGNRFRKSSEVEYLISDLRDLLLSNDQCCWGVSKTYIRQTPP